MGNSVASLIRSQIMLLFSLALVSVGVPLPSDSHTPTINLEATPAATSLPLSTTTPTPTPAPTPTLIESATDPDDCVCCERTLVAMERYCKAEMPMSDLKMDKFDCAKEMGTEITFNSESSHQRWSAIKSCKCDCDKRLAELKTIDCPMACKRLPFACPICTPPPPPPAPPPTPPSFTSECKPVAKPCCEAILENLEKFCYSFSPVGEVVKVPDPTHWDGGFWQPPASFDQLCESYLPAECGDCGAMACPRMLQLIGRRYHPHLCDAIKTCDDLCDNQCPKIDAASLVALKGDEKVTVTGTVPAPAMMQELASRK